MGKRHNVKVGEKYNHWTILEVLGQGGKCLCQCDCENKTTKIIKTYTLVSNSSKSCGCVKQKIHVGDNYGRLTVLELNASRTKGGKLLHKCKCECGKICYVQGGNLRNGHTKSCGCYNKERIHETFFQDLTGQVYGRLTVLSKFKEGNVWKYKCKCECGNETIVLSGDLKNGSTKSCGCLKKERQLEALTTCHNLSETRFWHCHKNMVRRCYDKTVKSYYNYGARGITVCDKWLNFNGFYEDMYESYQEHVKQYGEKDTTLDRIDVNGNYEPFNCRWATWKEQANNTRRTKYLTDSDGTTRPLIEWAEIKGLNPDTIRNRIYGLGWSDEDALNKEVRYHAY